MRAVHNDDLHLSTPPCMLSLQVGQLFHLKGARRVMRRTAAVAATVALLALVGCGDDGNTDITAAEFAAIIENEDVSADITQPDELLEHARDLCDLDESTLGYFLAISAEQGNRAGTHRFLDLAHEHVCPDNDVIADAITDAG